MSSLYFSVEVIANPFGGEVSQGQICLCLKEALTMEFLKAYGMNFDAERFEALTENLIEDDFLVHSSEEESVRKFFIELSHKVPTAMFTVRFSNIDDLDFSSFVFIDGKEQANPLYIEPARSEPLDEAKFRFGITFKNEGVRDLFRRHGYRIRFEPIGTAREEVLPCRLVMTLDGGIDFEGDANFILSETEVKIDAGGNILEFGRPQVLEYSLIAAEAELDLIVSVFSEKIKDLQAGKLKVVDDTFWGKIADCF